MPSNDSDEKIKGNRVLNIIGWADTIAIVSVVLWWILYNPGNSFGESEAAGVFAFQTYKGQLTALQFTGTFIAVIGVVTSLELRRLPDAIKVTGIAGALVVMLSQVMQIIQENFLLLAVVAVLVIYVGLVWLLMRGWGVLRRICPRK